jgi:hypothetical protein
LGVGVQSQRIALTDFVHSLNAIQLCHVQAMQVKVLAQIMTVITTAGDEPSPTLLRFIAFSEAGSGLRPTGSTQSLQAENSAPTLPKSKQHGESVPTFARDTGKDDNDLVKK